MKGVLSLHQWLAAERAAALRLRVAEMRSPPPSMDTPPDEALQSAMERVRAAQRTRELLTGWSAVVLRWAQPISTAWT